MKQPRRKISNINRKNDVKKKKINPRVKKKQYHPQYGTSKLEEDFAHNFLDKLGVDYEYQFEAKSIGRFYDFYIKGSNLLIEVDGDYFHSNPLIYEDKDLSRMQKKNRYVDEIKNKWALLNGIPLIRIWENDIRKHPTEVMNRLKERLYIEDKKNQKKRQHRKIL